MTDREQALTTALYCAVAVAYEAFASRQVYPFAPSDVNRVNDYLRGRAENDDRVGAITQAVRATVSTKA